MVEYCLGTFSGLGQSVSRERKRVRSWGLSVVRE